MPLSQRSQNLLQLITGSAPTMGSTACYEVPDNLFPLLCGVPAPIPVAAAVLPGFAADGLYSMRLQIDNNMFGHHLAVAITGGEATIFQAWVGNDGYGLSHWLNVAGNQVRAGNAPVHFTDAHRRYSPVGADYMNNPAAQFANFCQGVNTVIASWQIGNHVAADNAWAHVSGVFSGAILRMACWRPLLLETRFHAFSLATANHLAPVVVPIAPPAPPVVPVPLPIGPPPPPPLGPPPLAPPGPPPGGGGNAKLCGCVIS